MAFHRPFPAAFVVAASCALRPRLHGDMRPSRHEKEDHGWPQFLQSGPEIRSRLFQQRPGQGGTEKGRLAAQERGTSSCMDARTAAARLRAEEDIPVRAA
jgi:hypothetical protein